MTKVVHWSSVISR